MGLNLAFIGLAFFCTGAAAEIAAVKPADHDKGKPGAAIVKPAPDPRALRAKSLEVQKTLDEILVGKNPASAGEPGERLIQYRTGIERGIAEARQGKPATLHEALDMGRAAARDVSECNRVDELTKELYPSLETTPETKKIVGLRAMPTKQLLAEFSKGDEALQKEYWRRVHAVVTASAGVLSAHHVSRVLAQYNAINRDKAEEAGQRARLLTDFLSTGVTAETRKAFVKSLANTFAFPCADSFAGDLEVVSRVIDDKEPTADRYRDHREERSGERALRDAANRYFDLKPWNTRLFAAAQWPGGSDEERDKMLSTERAKFLAHLASADLKTNPHQPTLGEFLEMQKRQIALAEANKSSPGQAKMQFNDLIDMLAETGPDGSRFLNINGQKLPLKPWSTAGRSDFSWGLDKTGDDAILSRVPFANAKITVPEYSLTLAPPMSPDAVRFLVDVEKKNIEIFAQMGTEEDLPRVYNEQWASRRKAYESRYGSKPPANLFPTDPHKASSVPTSGNNAVVEQLQNSVNKLEEANRKLAEANERLEASQAKILKLLEAQERPISSPIP